MVRLADLVSAFERGQAFRALNERRGLDFHRRRPQSVHHAAPSMGSTRHAVDGWEMILAAPGQDPAADPDKVAGIALAALLRLRQTMLDVRPTVFKAIRADRIFIRNP